ncbi:MAG: TonB family protein [Verrucomicrobiae bacterium]|nr:TonB family protein [Verrucomicrobiae bacterium]
MSQLQKKCLVGSTTLHVLLLLTLLVGPAFLVKKQEPLNLPEITFEPAFLIDEQLSNPGGAAPGGPAPIQSPPEPSQPAPAPAPNPVPQPVETQPPAKVVEPKPAPKVVKPVETKFNDREVEKSPKSKPTHQVQVSKTKVPLNRSTAAKNQKPANDGAAAADSQRNSALATALRSTRSGLGKGLSSGTDVRMPDGQGGGSGAAYASYAQEIQRRYKAAYDRELQIAGDIADGQAQVETSIVVLRDGTVSSARILKPSGNAELNRLTQRVLDSVRQVPAFPSGTTDSTRTFNIVFDLKPRIGFG